MRSVDDRLRASFIEARRRRAPVFCPGLPLISFC